MFKRAVLFLVLALAGCASSSDYKTIVTIRNTTLMPLVIRVGNGVFGTSVTIPPGGTWSGTVDRRLITSSAEISIEPLYKPN